MSGRERRMEKGERRKEKGERRKEKGSALSVDKGKQRHSEAHCCTAAGLTSGAKPGCCPTRNRDVKEKERERRKERTKEK